MNQYSIHPRKSGRNTQNSRNLFIADICTHLSRFNDYAKMSLRQEPTVPGTPLAGPEPPNVLPDRRVHVSQVLPPTTPHRAPPNIARPLSRTAARSWLPSRPCTPADRIPGHTNRRNLPSTLIRSTIVSVSTRDVTYVQ